MNIAPPTPLNLKEKHLHFVGIGGCGMSGLARIAKGLGARCTGTDQSPSALTESLQSEGIPVTLKQDATTLPPTADWVVISAAIGPDHPEVLEAKRRSMEVLKYAQLLGRLMVGRRGVAVAGTHGKSTTTAMLAHILIQGGTDPSFIVGATCPQIGGGARVGGSDILVAEACEFDRSFLNFHPTHSLVLNIEEDHMEIYGTLQAIIEAFANFASRTSADGSLLIAHEGAHRTVVAAGLTCAVETIGFAPQADWQVTVNPSQTTLGQQVSLRRDGREVVNFQVAMPGEHMAYNAAAAAVTAHRLGMKWQDIAWALAGFHGLDRRMQVIGHVAGVTVVDDYGHHPTEIDTTLRALRAHHRPQDKGGRLICVFQPHQHSRTRFLLDQFAASFSQADIVIVPPIYFVRDSEADRRAVSSADLVDRLRQRSIQAIHMETFQQIVAHLKREVHPGDLVVAMGAGPVWEVARDFMAP